MDEVLAEIERRPAFRNWLVSGGWSRFFDGVTRSRAQAYANARTISGLDWLDLEGSAEWIITGFVQGTRRKPYETSLEIAVGRDDWSIESFCACAVGRDCKHAAAVLVYLQKSLSLQSQRSGDANAPDGPMLDHMLRLWLQEVEGAARTADEAKRAVTKTTPDTKFLAYCIEKMPSAPVAKFQFALRVATRLKDGKIRIQPNAANADPTKPPKYMERQDILLSTLYHQRLRKYGGWGLMELAGADWEDLLEGALATGRLYIGNAPGPQGSYAYRPMSAGPVAKVEAIWETLPDGSARPVLKGLPEGARLLSTEPPRYIDTEQAILGQVEGNLPGKVLSAWARGPVVLADRLPAVVERFSSLASSSLPTPVEVATEMLPAVPPRPHLHVKISPVANYMYEAETIVAELGFRYGDSPVLPPLGKLEIPQHAALKNGTRVIRPRDLKAEQAALRRLGEIGLVAATTMFPIAKPGSPIFHSFIPKQRTGSPEIDWINLLETPQLRTLKDQGWEIHIDTDCGLKTRDVTEFIPAIETESDHGIDWFRFDVSYVVDGMNFSLIPLIAHAIAQNYPPADSPNLPEFIFLPCEKIEDGYIKFPARQLMEIVDQVRHLFLGRTGEGPIRLDRMAAAGVADVMAIDASETTRALAMLGKALKDIKELPAAEVPEGVNASLRHYQEEGYRWLQFLSAHGLHGILADDMGLGKTLQTLTHLAAEHSRQPGKPSLVIAPTSVVPNWAAEAEKFVPGLKTLLLHGAKRGEDFDKISQAEVVFTSYPLLVRDFAYLEKQDWHVVVLDEAQHIKNPKAIVTQSACKLKAANRICLSGTPMENHLGELWSLMRFLMPGFLADEKTFNTQFRKPIERDRSREAQVALNRRVSPLILRRTKDQVAKELPEKTEIIHGIDLNKKQHDLYESVRASMDKRVREAIEANGLAKSHIIVLDALLKLRQICCHPQLLKSEAASKVSDSAKLDYLAEELLPTLLEEGRRILLFSQFTSMLELIEEHLKQEAIPYLKLTGSTKDRASLVKTFQGGEVPIFLISLKAGGTGLNLTAADTVIHYDPWWNPAAENQATDRAHRIGQTKPVFVHKLVCRGTIEDRILELQRHKSALVEALLSEDTAKLKIDAETLSHLLSPLE